MSSLTETKSPETKPKYIGSYSVRTHEMQLLIFNFHITNPGCSNLNVSNTLPHWKTEALSVKSHKSKRKTPQMDYRIPNTEVEIHDSTAYLVSVRDDRQTSCKAAPMFIPVTLASKMLQQTKTCLRQFSFTGFPGSPMTVMVNNGAHQPQGQMLLTGMGDFLHRGI